MEVTAWVLPYRTAEDRPTLQEVQWRALYSLVLPEDWEPWDADMMKKLEKEARTEGETMNERLARIARGEARWGCP